MSRYTTKTTFINDKYICRILYDNKPVVEAKVYFRHEIGPAFRDLFRTLNKCGGDDAFTSAVRKRKYKEGNRCLSVKHHWC